MTLSWLLMKPLEKWISVK